MRKATNIPPCFCRRAPPSISSQMTLNSPILVVSIRKHRIRHRVCDSEKNPFRTAASPVRPRIDVCLAPELVLSN